VRSLTCSFNHEHVDEIEIVNMREVDHCRRFFP
jgi:hypothetical protein